MDPEEERQIEMAVAATGFASSGAVDRLGRGEVSGWQILARGRLVDYFPILEWTESFSARRSDLPRS